MNGGDHKARVSERKDSGSWTRGSYPESGRKGKIIPGEKNNIMNKCWHKIMMHQYPLETSLESKIFSPSNKLPPPNQEFLWNISNIQQLYADTTTAVNKEFIRGLLLWNRKYQKKEGN